MDLLGIVGAIPDHVTHAPRIRPQNVVSLRLDKGSDIRGGEVAGVAVDGGFMGGEVEGVGGEGEGGGGDILKVVPREEPKETARGFHDV